jgi:tRNA-dihydrouridine synthase A
VGGHRLPQAQARAAAGCVAVSRPADRPGSRGVVRALSVAPMMDRTDRHYRRFARELTLETRLYTEMVTTAAVLHGDRERLLGQEPGLGPVALQLGGDDPEALAACAAVAAAWGYDEVDLNVGCPSPRVQRGRFGACLMKEPSVVAEAVRAMRDATHLPVTVKHRLGVDDHDDDQHLERFVTALLDAGVDGVVVHARTAWLRGLSPKENREVPPLEPQRVVALKRRFPELRVELNGGVRDLATAERWLQDVDGVMIGRAAFDDPWLLADADARLFGRGGRPRTRQGVVRGYLPYVEAMRAAGVPMTALTRPVLGLMNARPGARAFRRVISEGAHQSGAGPELLEAALGAVPEVVRCEPAGGLVDAGCVGGAPALRGDRSPSRPRGRDAAASVR